MALGNAAYKNLLLNQGISVRRFDQKNDLPVGREVSEYIRLVQAFQYSDKYGEVCPASWKPGKKAMKPNHDADMTKEFFEGQGKEWSW